MIRRELIFLSSVLLLVPAIVRADDVATLPADVRVSIDRATAYLLDSQNAEGSWGGPLGAVYTFTGQVWSNPETHRAWKVATTGLCCLALMEVEPTDRTREAVEKGIDYIAANVDVRRPNAWDTMNSWAYIYGLQAIAAALQHPFYVDSPQRNDLHDAADKLVAKLGEFQALHGGWGYLDLSPPVTQRLTWGTSFTTASGVVAMHEARRARVHVPDATFDKAVRAIRHCRLPSGAYTYSINPLTWTRHSEWIDQIKGSLSRIQACNIALKYGGEEITQDDFRTGLAHFFKHHRFLDIARARPIPHETFYYNSGYFYLYGHYHAALVIEELPESERAAQWQRLWPEIIKTQQKDGSMWDYDMHSYHKPYGTSFGLIALARSMKDSVFDDAP